MFRFLHDSIVLLERQIRRGEEYVIFISLSTLHHLTLVLELSLLFLYLLFQFTGFSFYPLTYSFKKNPCLPIVLFHLLLLFFSALSLFPIVPIHHCCLLQSPTTQHLYTSTYIFATLLNIKILLVFSQLLLNCLSSVVCFVLNSVRASLIDETATPKYFQLKLLFSN